MNDLAEKLKIIKTNKGLTFERISREIGVSFQTVYRWTHGKCSPSVHVVPKLEQFLKANE